MSLDLMSLKLLFLPTCTVQVGRNRSLRDMRSRDMGDTSFAERGGGWMGCGTRAVG